MTDNNIPTHHTGSFLLSLDELEMLAKAVRYYRDHAEHDDKTVFYLTELAMGVEEYADTLKRKHGLEQ